MWHAQLWLNLIGRAGIRILGFAMRGSHSSARVFQILAIGIMASGTHASEKASNISVGADAIYNPSTIQSRVFGGGDAEIDAWPSMAGIVVSGDFPLEDRFFCGGSVIADRWILTAAHCMFNPLGSEIEPVEIRVVVGINDLLDVTADERIVSNIFVHPQYNTGGGTLQNDIALLELANAVSVPVSTMFAGDTESLSDSLAHIAGWGATGVSQTNGSEIYPNLLQDASVPIVPLARCNSAESYQGGVLDTQVCAGYEEGGIDSCVGDSGGPLFVIENGVQVQVGITSFGNGCGLPNFYGVYTNVSAFRTWIGSYVEVIDSANTNGFIASNAVVSSTDNGASAGAGASAGEGTDVDSAGNAVDGQLESTANSESIDTAENEVTDTMTVGTAVDGSLGVSIGNGGGSANTGLILLLLGLAYSRRHPNSYYSRA